ncbi:hypothetical protein ACOMHN_033006 [Nucella lapillus]
MSLFCGFEYSTWRLFLMILDFGGILGSRLRGENMHHNKLISKALFVSLPPWRTSTITATILLLLLLLLLRNFLTPIIYTTTTTTIVILLFLLLFLTTTTITTITTTIVIITRSNQLPN